MDRIGRRAVAEPSPESARYGAELVISHGWAREPSGFSSPMATDAAPR
jgi:hypothetical protein